MHVWHPLCSSMSGDQHPPRLVVIERLVQPLKNAPFPLLRSSIGTSVAHSSVVDAARTPVTAGVVFFANKMQRQLVRHIR